MGQNVVELDIVQITLEGPGEISIEGIEAEEEQHSYWFVRGVHVGDTVTVTVRDIGEKEYDLHGLRAELIEKDRTLPLELATCETVSCPVTITEDRQEFRLRVWPVKENTDQPGLPGHIADIAYEREIRFMFNT